MDYSRSVVLGIRAFRRVLAVFLGFYLIARIFGIGPAWLRGPHGPLWLSVWVGFEILLSFVERKLSGEPPKGADWRPSAAVSGSGTVVAVGIAGAVETGRSAQNPSDLIVPGVILVVTVIAGVLVYRFAKRNEGQIGEARFDTTKR